VYRAIPGVRNDTWLTVPDKHSEQEYKKLKKELRNYLKKDWEQTKEDFQNIWEYIKTSSTTAYKNLKKFIDSYGNHVALIGLTGCGSYILCTRDYFKGDDIIGTILAALTGEIGHELLKKMITKKDPEYMELKKEIKKLERIIKKVNDEKSKKSASRAFERMLKRKYGKRPEIDEFRKKHRGNGKNRKLVSSSEEVHEQFG